MVDLHHNELADEWGTLCGIALTSTCISHDPIILSSKEVESLKHQTKQLPPLSYANSSNKNKNKTNTAYAGAKEDKGVHTCASSTSKSLTQNTSPIEAKTPNKYATEYKQQKRQIPQSLSCQMPTLFSFGLFF